MAIGLTNFEFNWVSSGPSAIAVLSSDKYEQMSYQMKNTQKSWEKKHKSPVCSFAC